MKRLPRQDWFGLAAFEPGAGRARAEAPLYLLESVDSTSDFLLGRGAGGIGRVCGWDGWGWQAPRQQRLAPPAAPAAGAVAVARRQTRGRGRMGRTWISAEGLLLSWLVPAAPTRSAASLAVWAGLVTAIVLREEFGLAVDLKWPNDLLIGPRKLGGLLLDAARTPTGPRLVAGLGLNLAVAAADLPVDLRGRATSFRIEKVRVPQPAIVAGAILARFDAELPSFRADGWSPYLRRFAACDRLRGRRITLATGQGPVTGRAAGIDETGALLLRRSDGSVARLLAGDVHVVDVAERPAGGGRMVRVLVIDVGNSRVAAALWTATPGAPGGAAADATPGGAPAGTMRRLREWPTPRDSAARTVLAAALTALTAAEGTTGAAIVSVVPTCGAALLAALPGAVPADHTSSLPFALGVAEPAAVGADRYCNLAAAVARGWRDALVVDAGTATTFDLLTDGCFRGGLIAPGMALAAQRLGEVAARLSPVPFASCPLEVGASTAAAMQAGAFHVGVLGVLGVVDGLLERYGPRPVVVTGGLGSHLARPGWLHDPDWTLRGALRLAWPALRDRPAI